MTWQSLLVTLLVGGVGAGGVIGFFYIGPTRRKYNSEAGANEATSASTLTGAALGQMNAAIERAARAEAKADATEAELVIEQRSRRRETAALRMEIRDLRNVLARPAVAAAVAASGGMPDRAELTNDTNEDGNV